MKRTIYADVLMKIGFACGVGVGVGASIMFILLNVGCLQICQFLIKRVGLF
jgi:hypothetical protein